MLSGFLIGGILYDAKDSKSYYRTFYSRRIYRIFPLYFIWLALFVVGLHFIHPYSGSEFRGIFNRNVPVWYYPLFLQNVSFAWQQKWGSAWMDSTWSLAVEEQFYLLLPLLVRNLSYRGLTALAMASIVCAPIIRMIWLSGNELAQYTLLPSRADALGFGVLIALACRNQRAWEWLVSHRAHLYWAFLLLGCGVAFLVKYPRHLYPFGLTWVAAFYTSLLLLTVVNPGPLETTSFRSQTLVKLGTVAYAVYIFHQGINALMRFAFFGERSNVSNWTSLSVTLLSLITVMLLAALSWRLLEKPLIQRSHIVYRY